MTTAPTSTTPDATPNFHFVSLFVRRLSFSEQPLPEGGAKPRAEGETRPVGLELEVNVAIAPDGREVQTTMRIVALPDQAFQPYRIEAMLTGVFRTVDDATQEQASQFAQRAAPVILFPYIRELIHRATIDARFGPTRLDPVNVLALLSRDGWKAVESPSAKKE